MFLAKIWFVVVAVLAAIAITIAIVVPRPAQRAAAVTETQRLRRSCQVARIVMKDNAWSRAQLASQFSTEMRAQLSETLRRASREEKISAELNTTGRKFLKQLVGTNDLKLSFVWVLDTRGRVVARDGQGAEKGYGDSVAGYHLVADALEGFVRDDLWNLGGQLFRVAASPVVDRQLNWAGAVVVGHAIDTEFAQTLGDQANSNIAFYLGENNVASNNTISIHKEVAEHAQKLGKSDTLDHCNEGELIEVKAGNQTYNALAARLPGEAGALGAYYGVFAAQEQARGFMAALGAVKSGDVSFSHFPWIRLVLALLLLIGIGAALIIFEVDKPLRRLNANAISLAKGDVDRLKEDSHRGKFGSVARSVNIAIDKMNRETKAAKKDLDQLLGPAPDAAIPGSFDASASALPALAPPPTAHTPPPSEFSFSDTGTPPPVATPMPSLAGATPPPSLPPMVAQAPVVETPTNQRIVPKPVALPELPVAPPAQPDRAAPASGKNELPPPNKSAALQDKPAASAAALSAIDDDILGDEGEQTSDSDFSDDPATRIFSQPLEPEETAIDSDENYYRSVFAEFIEVKERCGENTSALSFDKFSEKLRTNRNALMDKHNCASVKFQVYVRDGKAALKASPVRD